LLELARVPLELALPTFDAPPEVMTFDPAVLECVATV
jgi:hypothetical protein